MTNNKDYIYGFHPVQEALNEGEEFEKVFIQSNLKSENLRDLIKLLIEREIPFQKVPIQKLSRITRKNHQGIIAKISPIIFHKITDVIPDLYQEGKIPFILVLDQITDTRNLGAISRTAECAGINAILIPSTNTAQLSADAIKSSAGALLKIPLCRSKNLDQDVLFLKESGLNIFAASEKASKDYTEVDYTEPCAIVMGSEGKGISQSILENCNELISIPLLGEIKSLNVSVASGIILYEAVNQRIKNA
jgi:23S rRNA (guanosine2251-2'-O)-methyltransferase